MLTNHVPDATTVVLVREGDGPPEIFMVKRGGGADFHGDAFVFPGGRVEESDQALAAHCADIDARDWERLQAENLSEEEALGCWVGAIRELFEEVGVLLAYRDGAPLDFSDDATTATFRRYREQAAKTEISFFEIVEREDLTLATDRLRYFSRYVTPPYAPKRYDTRFVIAVAPEDQLPEHDAYEVVDGEWLTAEAAIGCYADRSKQIVPPTLQNLTEIAQATSVEELMTRCDTKAITAICPAAAYVDGVYTIIYPGDRDYLPTLEPGFVSLDKRPAPLPILRFTLEKDGRWERAQGFPRAEQAGER